MDDPKPSALGETRRVLVAAVTTCVVATAFAIADLAEPVATVFAIAAIVIVAWTGIGFHVVRAGFGRAYVFNRPIPRPDGGFDFVRVLKQGGVYQSATYLDERWAEPVFAYQRAFDVLFDAENELAASRCKGIPGDKGGCRDGGESVAGGEMPPVSRRVLALGGGGFAWPKHAVMTRPDLSVDAVEIDGDIIDAARRWFGLALAETLSEGRLNVIEADGRAFLEDAGAATYDAVVNDTFSGDEPVYALATVEAARAAKRALAPGGIYLANVVTREAGADTGFLRDEVATLNEVFERVYVLPATDEELAGEENYLLLATDADLDLPQAIPYDEDFLGEILYDA